MLCTAQLLQARRGRVLRAASALLWVAVSLLLVSACADSPTAAPPLQLPSADPGYRLGVPAPGYGTSVDWDLQSNRLIVGERELWSIDLTTRSMTQLPADVSVAIASPISHLRVSSATGAIFLTAPQTNGMNILSRLERGAARAEEITQFAAQAIGISSNGRWLLYASLPTNAVTRLDTETGERTPIAHTTWFIPYVLSDDGRLGMVGVCSTPGAACQLAILDVETQAARPVEPPGQIAIGSGSFASIVHAFVGKELVVLIARIIDGQITYFEWNESTKAERRLGAVALPVTDPGCVGWSPATHSMVAVLGITDLVYGQTTRRFGVYAIAAGTSTMIRTADLFNATACSLSRDGRWFVYGNSTGLLTGGDRTLYLTPVP